MQHLAWHDGVAHFDRGDALAHGLDDGAGLVPEDAGEEALRVLPAERVDVGVAQRVAHNIDTDLAGFRRRDDDLLLAQVVDAERHHGLAGDRDRAWLAHSSELSCPGALSGCRRVAARSPGQNLADPFRAC